MSSRAPHHGYHPSFDGSGTLSIVAQRLGDRWSLLLWWDEALPHQLVGRRGRERRWRKLSRALQFAARRYPSVSSFQLFWPVPRPPARTRSTSTGTAPSSSTAEPPSPRP